MSNVCYGYTPGFNEYHIVFNGRTLCGEKPSVRSIAPDKERALCESCKDLAEQFTAFQADAAVTGDDYTYLQCAACGETNTMAQQDTVPALALITGLDADGVIIWSGGSDMDWDMQRPAADPPMYQCTACGSCVSFDQIKQVGSE